MNPITPEILRRLQGSRKPSLAQPSPHHETAQPTHTNLKADLPRILKEALKDEHSRSILLEQLKITLPELIRLNGLGDGLWETLLEASTLNIEKGPLEKFRNTGSDDDGEQADGSHKKVSNSKSVKSKDALLVDLVHSHCGSDRDLLEAVAENFLATASLFPSELAVREFTKIEQAYKNLEVERSSLEDKNRAYRALADTCWKSWKGSFYKMLDIWNFIQKLRLDQREEYEKHGTKVHEPSPADKKIFKQEKLQFVCLVDNHHVEPYFPHLDEREQVFKALPYTAKSRS